MKKNWLLFIGLILVVGGVAFSYLANFELADVSSFAVTMFGAGLAACTLWNKRDTTKKTWLSVVGLVLIGLGGFVLGFGGFTESTMTTIISSVFGFMAIIAGLVTSVIQAKSE